MTLIASASYYNYALQVSDRLVTWRGSFKSVHDYDREFNKSVLAYLPRGLVTISFTGDAYLGPDRLTTDQWIAQELAGSPLGSKDDPPPRHPGSGGPFIRQHLDGLARSWARALQS